MYERNKLLALADDDRSKVMRAEVEGQVGSVVARKFILNQIVSYTATYPLCMVKYE